MGLEQRLYRPLAGRDRKKPRNQPLRFFRNNTPGVSSAPSYSIERQPATSRLSRPRFKRLGATSATLSVDAPSIISRNTVYIFIYYSRERVQ
jgi:hypothetical protein